MSVDIKSEYPVDNPAFLIRPASPDEAGLFYALPPEQDAALGAIGHVRIDFGREGTKFWHTWHPRGPEALNSPAFQAELQKVIDRLRQSVLKNFSAMTSYCRNHGGEISGGWVQNYGYIVETERYRYCLRCNPIAGDYQAYLTAFDLNVQRQNQVQEEKSVVGMVSFASGEQMEYTDAEEYLQCVREELPYRQTSGFRYETLTDDPAVRKAVDDILYDFCGEENPRSLEDYQMAEETNQTMGGMSL